MKWLAMWCNEGFETIMDITKYEEWEKETVVAILRDNEPKSNPLWTIINSMKLRATFNRQREYEIYAFASSDSITKESLDNWADTDPQTLVDWIRENGVKVLSHRSTNRKAIV